MRVKYFIIVDFPKKFLIQLECDAKHQRPFIRWHQICLSIHVWVCTYIRKYKYVYVCMYVSHEMIFIYEMIAVEFANAIRSVCFFLPFVRMDNGARY